MKNREYWAGRMQALEDEQYQRSKEYYKDLQEQFNQASRSLQADIELWYCRLAENNEISYTEAKKLLKGRQLDEFKWTVEQYIKAGEENAIDQRWMKELENASARYHIERLEAMKLQLSQHVEQLFQEYESGMTAHLRESCAESFYRSAYEISRGVGVGFNLSKLDTRRIDALIKHPWGQDGKAFSDRIWSNKEKLVSNLRTELTQCIIRGDPPRTAIERLAKRMSVSREQAGTLVMTESAAIASASQKECFKELNVETFQFDATLDGETCEVCQSMDQKLFKMSQFEIGVTAPPIHPRCRCCAVPGFDDWDKFDTNLERAARDPNTGDTVYVDGSLDYGEWKKKIFEQKNELKEYRIIDISGRKAVLKDRIPIEKTLSELPGRIIDSLQDVTIKLNSNMGSGYQPGEKIIYYSPNATRREVFHEVGHALEEIMFDAEKVRKFKEKILYGLSRDDILIKSASDSSGNRVNIFLLNSDKFIDGYQSRLYVDTMEEALLPDGSIDPDVLGEFISVSVERYFCFPKSMKKNFPEFYLFVDEVLK